MNQAVVTFSIAVLALAGCESNNSSSSGGSLTPSTRTVERTEPLGNYLGIFTEEEDNTFISASNAKDAFRVISTEIDARGRVTVMIRGELNNNQGDDDTTLESGTDIDDVTGNDVGAQLDDIGGDANADTRQATLTFELNNDLDLGETADLPSIAPSNIPVWTAFNDDPPNLYYRNRARTIANDRSRLFKDDPNYVEYHALTYLDDDAIGEIVRVEVVLLNYDDGEDANDDDNTMVNFNALEKGGEDNIALGLRFDPADRTAINSDGDSPVTGSVRYRGRYMGQNRLRFFSGSGYDVDGDDGILGVNSAIVIRESNIPVMTMNVNFGAADDQVTFRIQNAHLSVDEEVDNVDVEGSMSMNIEGRAFLIRPSGGGAISLSNGAITRLDAGNLLLTFTNGDVSATDTIDLGNLVVGDSTADSSITGYFFDRGDSASLRARAVAGNIYWDAFSTLEHTPQRTTEEITFLVFHEMAGVFLLER